MVSHIPLQLNFKHSERNIQRAKGAQKGQKTQTHPIHLQHPIYSNNIPSHCWLLKTFPLIHWQSHRPIFQYKTKTHNPFGKTGEHFEKRHSNRAQPWEPRRRRFIQQRVAGCCESLQFETSFTEKLTEGRVEKRVDLVTFNCRLFH